MYKCTNVETIYESVCVALEKFNKNPEPLSQLKSINRRWEWFCKTGVWETELRLNCFQRSDSEGWKRNIGLIVIVDITFDWMRNIGASHYRHCLKENSLNRNIIIDRWRWYMVTIVALKNISTYANVNALPMQCNGWIYIRLIQKIVIIIANTFLAEISLKI